jgi:antitoxin component YwqK of YwqJK toxin-antitoxin module
MIKLFKTIFFLIVLFVLNNQVNAQNQVLFESQLKSQNQELFLNEKPYTGFVLNFFDNGQAKSLYEVQNGKIEGKVIEYIFDKFFNKNNFKDTVEINRTTKEFTSKKKEFDLLIQDTIRISKEAKDYLNYEIGGIDKWSKLKEKNDAGKLNKRKKEEFDRYDSLVQTKNQSIRKLNNVKTELNSLELKINKEASKFDYNPKKSIEFNLINSIKEGEAIVYDSSGNKFGEGSYLNGKQNGKWVYYFSNGKKLAEGSFINGDESEKGESGVPKNGRDGIWNFYHENGKINEDANYKDGLLNGSRKSYFENGQLNEEENYQNGRLNGIRKVYLENGSLKEEGKYENGKENGMFAFYNENGTKEQESIYLNGIKNGKEVLFYKNGKIKAEYFIQDTVRNGTFISYFESGKKELESVLKNGKTGGIVKKYYENGKLEFESNFKNGKTHGPFKFYFESGALKSKGSVDTLSGHKDKFIGDLFSYSEDGNLEKHFYISNDGTLEDKMVNNSKSTTSKSKNSNSEMNKSYKCKCCKSTINGLTDAVDKDGNDFTQWIFDINANAYYSLESSFKALGFTDVYDYMRKNEYPFCSMKCSRACY